MVADDADAASLALRMDLVGEAVAAWRAASSIREAWASAEAAANLIVGPNGPGEGIGKKIVTKQDCMVKY